MELVARGIPEICLVDGDCRTCKYRGAVPAIDDTVESTRALIEAMGSDAQITRTSEFPASVQVEDMRKAVGAARREFFTSSGHYAKDVAKSAAEKVVNEKLAQLHLQKQEQSLREKLGVKNGAGKMPTIEAERNIAILDAMSRIGDPDEPAVDEMFTRIFGDIASMSRNAPAAVCASCSVPPTRCARRWIGTRTRVRRTWSSRFPTASSAIVRRRLSEEVYRDRACRLHGGAVRFRAAPDPHSRSAQTNRHADGVQEEQIGKNPFRSKRQR